LVDFHATKAIESKLSKAQEELDSAKIFAQLLTLATTLDISKSYTNTDRDTALTLLEQAQGKNFRSEPAFTSLLEKIIDSFAASNNHMQLLKLVKMYEKESLNSPGIATTLVQHFGRAYLAETDNDNASAIENYDYLSKFTIALQGTNAKAIAEALSILAEYKKNKEIARDSIRIKLESIQQSFLPDEKEMFIAIIKNHTDPIEMGSKKTPELIRIAHFTNIFIATFKDDLLQFISPPNSSSSNDPIK
jgi:hypothetical protein